MSTLKSFFHESYTYLLSGRQECNIFLQNKLEFQSQLETENIIPLREPIHQTNTLKELAKQIRTPFCLFYLKNAPVKLAPYALERMVQVAETTGATMVYSDHYSLKKGVSLPHPTIEYQIGSLRNDFGFGSLILFNTVKFKQAVEKIRTTYRYAPYMIYGYVYRGRE